MKINKRNPLHWLYLLLFGVNVVVAILLRPLLHRRCSGRVLLYGHKRNGNLLAIHDWVLQRHPEGLNMRYLTMDPIYHRELRRHGVPCVLAIGPAAIVWLATSDAIISDHGLHVMRFMIYATDLKFFDVWHGIPFKGFNAKDFKLQRRYDEIWVASECCRDMYIERFGFDEDRVHVTGYARTDRLVEKRQDGDKALLHSLGVSEQTWTVLFAPTWTQDDQGRSIFPFDCAEEQFFEAVADVARECGAVVLWRDHLNMSGVAKKAHANVIPIPASDYPDSEAIIRAADVLVCDWSSIAFDFLLLDRPAIFLNVPAPFRNGFSLGPEFRYGEIANDLHRLKESLWICLKHPETYWRRQREAHQRIRREVFGAYADGRSARRCVDRLQLAVNSRRS